jgi:molybdopterin-containing oxidoreductase family iron-sulfur binding subunit
MSDVASPNSKREPKSGRRKFLAETAKTVLAGLIAFPLVGQTSVIQQVVSQKDVPKRLAMKRLYVDEAHRNLGDVLTRVGISEPNMASDKVLLNAAMPTGQQQAVAVLTLESPVQLRSSDPEIEDPVARMEADLQRALAKPMEQRRWGMVLDLRKCVGCSACTVACKAENKLPPGVVYRPVIVNEVGTFPNVSMQFIPRPCMQCENPPCVPVCPVGATYKRPDGIVTIDYDVCIGCRYCLTACPYQARTFDWGLYYTNNTPELESYETVPSFEYGEEWPRDSLDSPINNARKCHFCIHRLEARMLPACVTTCIGRATYLGDLNDPESLTSKLTSRPNAIRLKEELGTEPKVYYLL